MSDLIDIVEFRSPEFAPLLPDESQVNPGVYGAELAYWLSGALARAGTTTSYPESEDWGWYVEYSTESGAEFAVHCGNIDGTDDRWLLSLRRFGRKLFGRDKPSFSEARPLVDAIQRCLESHGSITDMEWRYQEPAE